MKKYFNYALVGAIALTGAVGLASCSSSNDEVVAENNPTFNTVENEVNVQFVLNVSAAPSGNTRQTSTTVQKNGNFRGMQDVKLIGLATGKAATFVAPYAGETTQTSWTEGSDMKAKTYDLGTLYRSNAVDNTGTNNANNSSHRIVELTLPLTTDAMLVYGRAIPGGIVEADGKIVYNVVKAAENTTFDLVSRLGDDAAKTKYQHTCNLVALILNRIMLSEVAERAYDADDPYKTPRTATDEDAYAQTENLAALSWRKIGTDETGSLVPLQENLSKLYKAITSYTTSGTVIRSGSASSVFDMVKDAHTIAKSVYHAIPTNDAELNAQRLAYEILTRIEYYFTPDAGTINGFRSVGSSTTEGSIAYALINHNVMTAADFTTNFGDVTDALLVNLPTSFSLPAGVSQLFFTAYSATTGPADNGFSYNSPSQSLIDISNTLDPTKYMYPSELLYFDNSLLRVNDADVAAANYPNGYTPWDTEGSWSDGWTTGKVASSTRSVAVKNNINYGVAMLQTSVALQSEPDDGETDVTFKDNRSAIVTTEADQKLSVNDVKKFTLTGVLIGGQYKKLGWNYLAKTGTASNDNYVIYDNRIANNGTIPTTANGENYTLVFDNYDVSGTQQDVLVALEFQNDSEKEFYGVGGIIPKDSKFYLVGKLKLGTNLIADANWPTTYAIPPYDATGASTKTTRIFIQDFMTTATFTIGSGSLKKAYNTVPDLRASQTSLGLSVDLQWRPGLSFETVLGDTTLGD